jgi:glycosyltransferase involved in cell wall biosynthesis
MPQVLRELPTRQIILALAGDGELRESLKAQVRRLELDSVVRFLGFRDDVPDLLKAADLFVLPSHMEGLCSTLIDVMVARTPIVATTAGGIPDLLGQRQSEPAVATLVPPRDPAALACAIVEAIRDSERNKPLVDRAEQRALRLFTHDQMVERTLSVYRELIGSHRVTC